MAIYRNVMMSFWTDTKIADNFTPEDRYFYLYLFTNPHTNLCGCYELSLKFVSVETGYNRETIEKLLKRFEQDHNVLRYDAKTKEVLILNWHRYNWTTSEKFRKPLYEEIKSVRNLDFRTYLEDLYNENDTVSIPYAYGMDTTDTVTVTDTVSVNNKNIRKKSERNIIPPTRDMVEAYISEQGYNVNADAFMDYYNSNGWHVGRNKMKDWQAAVRTWEKRNTPKEQDAFEIAKERFLRG